MTEKLYEQIASQLRGQIARGVYPPGERLPGIRKLKTGLGVSISTVLSALALLEAEGLIEAQSRSGFYVKPVTLAHITLPTASQPDLTWATDRPMASVGKKHSSGTAVLSCKIST